MNLLHPQQQVITAQFSQNLIPLISHIIKQQSPFTLKNCYIVDMQTQYSQDTNAVSLTCTLLIDSITTNPAKPEEIESLNTKPNIKLKFKFIAE